MAVTLTKVTGESAKAKFFYSIDAGSTWIPILNMRALGVPGGTRETHDVTDTDNTSGYREYLGGWRDKEDQAFTSHYTQANYVQLKVIEALGLLDWKVEYADAAQTTTDPAFTFQGLISAGPKINMEFEDKWTLDFSIKGSGDETFVEGTTV